MLEDIEKLWKNHCHDTSHSQLHKNLNCYFNYIINFRTHYLCIKGLVLQTIALVEAPLKIVAIYKDII